MKKIFTIFSLLMTMSMSNAFTQEIDLDSGLVAYYPFYGNAHDASGNNHDGSVYGATLTADRFGNADRAFSFNGTSDYIECNTIPVLDSVFTYCAWVKVTRPAGSDWNNNFGCFGTIGVGLSTWDWAYNVTSQKIWVFDKTNHETDYPIVIDTNWLFVVVRYTGTMRSIYIDGEPFGSPQSINTPITSWPTDVLRIGSHTNNSQQFMGSIDDVRLYCRALSETEINELYHEGGWPLVGIQSYNGKDFIVCIFPNPTDGNVFISSHSELRLSVYNLVGQKVFTGNTSEVHSVLLPHTGVYLFELTSGENTICEKVIVK